MKHKATIFLTLLITFYTFSQKKKENKDLNYSKRESEKIYVGFEKLNMFINEKTKTYSNIETDKPKNKWFHKYSLRIKKDSVFLDKRAIIRNGKETYYSESDGGFYYYRGIIITKNNEKIIELTEMECDYCAKLIAKEGEKPIEPKKIYGRISKNGIEIDNIKFDKIEYNKLKLGSEYRKN